MSWLTGLQQKGSYPVNMQMRVLPLVLAVSVALRVAVALYLGDEVDAPPQLTDQRSYHALGVRLVAGHGFSFEQNWYPFTLANRPTAHWSFLYSLFVAAVYAVSGPHPLALRLIQAILGGLLLPWMVYRLARSLWDRLVPRGESWGERVALLATFMAAVYPYFVLYAATLMTETFYIVALLWSLERSLKLAAGLRQREPWARPWVTIVGLGISLGTAVLLRQSLLPWLPVLSLYLLWIGWRARRLRVAGVALMCALAITMAFVLPWTIRNYVVYGDFLLLNSNAGYAMYSAQHPMHGTSFREFEAAPLPDGFWGRPEPELDRMLMQIGIRFVMDEPGRYLLLSLSRVRAFFEFWPTPDTTLLHNIGRIGAYGLLLPFMVYGLFLALRDRAFLACNGLLLLFAGFYTLLHLLTWAMVRYRLPVDAMLMPLASWAVVDLAQRARAFLGRRVHWAGVRGSRKESPDSSG